MYCFKNGDIIPCEQAVVHVSDLGLLRSYAAFDYLRTYGGRPFHLAQHLQRFRNSAAGLGLSIAYSDAEITAIIGELLEKSGLPEAAFRLVITGGNSPDSMTIVQPNFFITTEKLPHYGPEYFEKGVKLITNEYLRDVPELKSTGYLNAIKLAPLVRQHGAHDMLYCHDGQVLELTRNNMFFFMGGTLVTPRDNILPGVTRGVVLDLCRGVFPIEERAVGVDEIARASEAFLTGTTKGVMPVVQIDDTIIGDGTVGPNTRRLMDLFRTHTHHH
ncbi:MAG TPA: aminotransferase class IV [Candidatus Krumholzibacteria bacterium]|nr:aminotransferase class IV [Candidatus Krumholzibacteria bacterium]